MRSFKEANTAKDKYKDKRELTEGRDPPTSFEEALGRRLARALPEVLMGGGEDIATRRQEQFDEEREEYADEIDRSLEIDLGTDDILGDIRQINEIDLETTENEIDLLTVIAQSNRALSTLLSVVLENQVDTVLELTRIRQHVAPSFATTVSGVSTIETPGEPTPVIPDSDERSFDVTQIFIRSMPYNTHSIYFGDDGVQPESGFVLRPGEYITLEVDFRDTTIYMASEETGQDVGVMGVI